jgi:DNA-binding MarR family transcriptional regulator
VGHTGVPLSSSRFARIPTEVSTDHRLVARDVRVYEAISMSSWNGPVVEIGKRLLARRARCAERLVLKSLRSLEAAGHIEKQPRKRGQRARYVLLSPVFAQKQRSSAEEILDSGDGQSTWPAVRKDARTAFTSGPRRRSDAADGVLRSQDTGQRFRKEVK